MIRIEEIDNLLSRHVVDGDLLEYIYNVAYH